MTSKARMQNPNRRRGLTRKKRKLKYDRGIKPQKILFDPVCGVDIASEGFDPCIVVPEQGSNNEPVLLRIDRYFDMNDRGFTSFKKFLVKHGVKRIAMESTGVYHEGLHQYLFNEGFTVYVVNPLFISRGKGDPKRDKLDAYDIAIKLFYGEIGTDGRFLPSYFPPTEAERNCKRITREIINVTAARTTAKNRIHKTFAARSIKLKPYIAGSNKMPWYLALRALVDGKTAQQYLQWIRTTPTLHGLTRNAVVRKEEEIKSFFQLSNQKLDGTDMSILRRNLDTIRSCDDIIEDLNSQIEYLLDQLPKSTLRLIQIASELVGVQENLALRIALEYGDVRRFSNRRKMGSYTGLEPKVNRSGGKGSMRSITKRGNKYLRSALFLAADNARMAKGQYQAMYATYRRKGRKHRQACCAIGRKLGVAYAQRAKFDEEYNRLLNEEIQERNSKPGITKDTTTAIS